MSMKRRILLVGLAAGVVAAPVALAEKPETTPVKPMKPAVAKHTPVVSYLFKGRVMSEMVDPAVKTVVISPVLGTNLHARRYLGAATVEPKSMTVNLDGTLIRSRVVGPDGKKTFPIEAYADLKKGDVVYFHIRAKKGLKAANPLDVLPAAKWLRDLTPNPPVATTV
jgi:hypothetical protein